MIKLIKDTIGSFLRNNVVSDNRPLPDNFCDIVKLLCSSLIGATAVHTLIVFYSWIVINALVMPVLMYIHGIDLDSDLVYACIITWITLAVLLITCIFCLARNRFREFYGDTVETSTAFVNSRKLYDSWKEKYCPMVEWTTEDDKDK